MSWQVSEKPSKPRVHDISPEIGVGTPVWPGDAPFELNWTSSLAEGETANVSRIAFSPHTGCHVDAPLHLIADGEDSANQPLVPFLGRVRVIDWVGKGMIGAQALPELEWEGVERVLFRTRANGTTQQFDEEMKTFTPEGARYLVQHQLLLVGVDVPSVDHFSSEELPVHHLFVENRISILEGLELANIAAGEYELIALPLRIRGGEASPVRAILRDLD